MTQTNIKENSADINDGLINEKQAAEYLGYTVRALQNWRVRGGGPKFVRISPRSIRYRLRDLDAWIDERTVASTSQPSPYLAG
ncbi:helix-turn-helix transcriptional regulator [Sneathiella sp. HT1-7]|uniref:helix-turn-helix transcriptional regulator n=1 Tax=Sneathiella sp. HT1-7 TaxID=2887192 RepID=UPI001D153743|nr:helix-turn-helix domain-containing protein [Sneathiella sp. HT1-7]MCC3305534.1 helix-turn-helix domain-containing protein [Sneathiella sp. HT1-7]